MPLITKLPWIRRYAIENERLRAKLTESRQQIRELCHQVNPAGEGPKIVALTAHAFEEQRQALLDCGFDDLVRKPYRRSDIAATLERHLRVSLASAGGLPGAERPAPSAAKPVPTALE